MNYPVAYSPRQTKRIDALERSLKRALARIRALEQRPAQVVTVKHVGGWNP